jgi:hypothetical protein
VPVLAHEIGHHVYAPATLTDHARMLARMRRGLPTVEAHAPMVANLYTDLLINDRLQRSAGLDMRACTSACAPARAAPCGRCTCASTRSCGAAAREPARRHDRREARRRRVARRPARAQLRARLAQGLGRFAALLLPHLLEDQKSGQVIAAWLDTSGAGAGGYPDGLVDEDPDERDGAIHPALDPALNGEMETGEGKERPSRPWRGDRARARQARQPFELGEICARWGSS